MNCGWKRDCDDDDNNDDDLKDVNKCGNNDSRIHG
jgi:hypothetical protein